MKTFSTYGTSIKYGLLSLLKTKKAAEGDQQPREGAEAHPRLPGGRVRHGQRGPLQGGRVQAGQDQDGRGAVGGLHLGVLPGAQGHEGTGGDARNRLPGD